MKLLTRLLSNYTLITLLLFFTFSCIESTDKLLYSKQESQKIQSNTAFLYTLAKDLNSGDTTTISFGIFGSLSKYFYKATIKKNLNSVFLEIRAQEADQEKTIYFGETRYCINSNSFGFENLFFHIAKDSSLSFEMKPNYRRVMTVLARGHDRIDLYIEKESGLSEYVNNYLIQLVLFYYPNNKTIQSITEKLKL